MTIVTTDAEASVAPRRPPGRRRRPGLLRQLNPTRCSALYLWLAFMVVFSFANDQYLTATTTRPVFNEGVVTAILALAFYADDRRALDRPGSAVMGLAQGSPTGSASRRRCRRGGALAALAACGAVGALGFVVVKLKVHSFVATLGVSQLITASSSWCPTTAR